MNDPSASNGLAIVCAVGGDGASGAEPREGNRDGCHVLAEFAGRGDVRPGPRSAAGARVDDGRGRASS